MSDNVLKVSAGLGAAAAVEPDPAASAFAASLEEQAGILATLSQECSEGVIICDPQQRILFVNRAFESITGFSASEAIGRTPRILQSGRQDRRFYERMWHTLKRTGQWRGELCNKRSDGTYYVEYLSISAVLDQAGAVRHYVGVFTDLTQRMRAEHHVRQLKSLDALTYLPNRASLAERLEEAIVEARKNNGTVAMLHIDLDSFKNINYSIGHHAGDLVLRIIGRRLRQLVRNNSDTVARMGGDEFAVVMTDVEDRDQVARLARRLLRALQEPFLIGDRELELSGTIGICLFPDDAIGPAEMIRNADTAMYRAKTLGRNTSQFYTRAMSERAREVLDVETGLRQALRLNQFELYYQPMLDLRTGALAGAEALIRWNRPGVGLVAPGEFIDVAEQSGLITEIGDWTLQAAALQMAQWDAGGLLPCAVSVNLSPTQFHHRALLERVTTAMQGSNIAPSRLELEITEGALMQPTDTTKELLRELKRIGVRLAIDDFGTGYSALGYLRHFPLDKIKIDRSFVNEMTADSGTLGIVGGIIELAHNLKLQVVAEGVETAQQLAMLRQLKCDLVQGYLISRPLPADRFARFAREWSPEQLEVTDCS